MHNHPLQPKKNFCLANVPTSSVLLSLAVCGSLRVGAVTHKQAFHHFRFAHPWEQVHSLSGVRCTWCDILVCDEHSIFEWCCPGFVRCTQLSRSIPTTHDPDDNPIESGVNANPVLYPISRLLARLDHTTRSIPVDN
jgi:hypothetical protein